MRFYQTVFVLISVFAAFACTGEPRPETPMQTFVAYTQAIKKDDAAQMKKYLSKETLKMAENEAKAQNAALDEVIKRETLFSKEQRGLDFRNVKTDGDKATIEVKDSTGVWNTVQFVKEDDIWKIDKKAYADDLEKQIEEDNKRLDEQINQSRQQ
jgi:hypothetical protein